MEKYKNPMEYYDVPKSWTLSSAEILDKYKVDENHGLTEKDIIERKKQFGKNRIKKKKKKKAWIIFIEQFKNMIMLILFIASALAFIFTGWMDGTAILAAILLNAFIGFFMELQAARTMESLYAMGTLENRVLRSGKQRRISAQKLLPGDILFFEGGDALTADIRIIEANHLFAKESALTGEAEAVEKKDGPLDEETVLAKRNNMLFKGTSIVQGSGKGMVVSTGLNTELGRISRLVQEAEKDDDPLERRIATLGKRLIRFILVVVGIIGILGLVMQRDLLLMIELTIALAVAAVPEGLAIVESLSLAKGMKRMARKNALVKRLSAVQTLGSTTLICTDKTGTLTENTMTVTRLELPGQSYYLSGKAYEKKGQFYADSEKQKKISLKEHPDAEFLLLIGALCNNASIGESKTGEATESHKENLGDPTEQALLVAARKAGIEHHRISEQYQEVKEFAFDPDKKMMATIHKNDEKYLTAVKGAPSAVLERCSKIKNRNQTEPLNQEARDHWLETNQELASQGLRILAVASKQTNHIPDDPYNNLEFYGLACLLDPPRHEVKEAILQCQNAGIRVIMITGDQKTTAAYIAQKMNLTQETSGILNGIELDEKLNSGQPLSGIRVFARVSPEQKLKLISYYKDQGEIVAMTGDGINDAPALKRADIGIAMGQRGEQAAKEAADLILLDDSFNSIVQAVEYGRSIFENIRKFIVYLISGNLGEILLVAASSIGGLPIALLPLQILYLNTINDVFPALALGVTKGEPDIMRRPPRNPEVPFITKSQWKDLFVFSVFIFISVFTSFLIALRVLGLSYQQSNTVAFISIALSRLWHVFNMRNPEISLFKSQITRNPYIWGAFGLCVLLILAAVFSPGISQFLGLTLIPAKAWALTILGSFFPLVTCQLYLMIKNKVKS